VPSATPRRSPSRSRAPIGNGELRVDRQTAQIEQQFLPGLRALADAVGKPNRFLLALAAGADDHELPLALVPMITSRHCASSSSQLVWVGMYREREIGRLRLPPGGARGESLLEEVVWHISNRRPFSRKTSMARTD
jgi:hypothetical protein